MPRFVGLDHVDAYFVADLHGDARRLTPTRRGGRRFSSLSEPAEVQETGRTALSYFIEEESIAASERVSLAQTLVTGLSPDGASLIRAVLSERSLRRIAEDHGISVQAVSQRLARLRRHFPQLDQWWLARHANRQGGRRCSLGRSDAGQAGLGAAPLQGHQSALVVDGGSPPSPR